MSSERTSLTLGVFPYYPNNPWQELMYAEMRSEGVVIVPLGSIEDLEWVEAAERAGDAVAVHINWTTPLTQVGSIAEVYDRVERTTAMLETLAQRGVATIWTVHNVLPHDAHHLLPEVALCRALAEKVDLITVINPGTRRAVLPWYVLPPEKVVELPLPNYLGTYPDQVSRAEARQRLAIEPSICTLLLLGALRPYKGIEEAVSAMPRLRRELPGTRLLIVGEVGPGYDDAALEAIVRDVAGVELHVGYVRDADLQLWMRAADAMLLPYRAGLNSSVLVLAAGFGLPVIMSESDAARGYEDASWVHVIPAGQDLSTGILDGVRCFQRTDPGPDALAAARLQDPRRISRLFADKVRAAVERRRGIPIE